MQTNPDDAARFLSALCDDGRHTFQTFGKAGDKSLSRVIHGTFAARRALLVQLNERGAGVFVMVNRGDGKGRKASNVTHARALFVDLDGAPLEPVLAGPIHPRIVVESSHGRWHAYWPVADLPLEHFTQAQKALAGRFGADPCVCDKPRVMRVPGFIHHHPKTVSGPTVSRLVQCDPMPLTWQEMADAFGLTQRMTLPAVIEAGERNGTLFKLARSAAAKGTPQSEQLRRLLELNGKACSPEPLARAEVQAIVASAYRSVQDCAMVMPLPLAALDSQAFKALDDRARMLLVLAYRKADGYNSGRLPLVWSELREWFPREKTFTATRKRLCDSGLISVATAATKAMPNRGRGPKPNFYRLAIPPSSAPYSKRPIPPSSALPEALQAVGCLGSEEALGGDDPVGTKL